MGFGKDGKGAIVKEQTNLSLGALAGQDTVLASSSVVLDADFRILKSEITCVLRGMTSLEGQGLKLYMTNGSLSSTEVEESIEQNGPLRRGDPVAEAIAERWVRQVGITVGPTVNETERVFRGEGNSGLMTIKPRWTFQRGRTGSEGGWNWVIYNSGVSITAGGSGDLVATHYGVWLD